SIEIMQAPIISTGHVSERDSKLITQGIEDRSINGMQRDEGWLVHIATNLKDREYVSNIPSLVQVLKHFAAYDYHWVMFDCDGNHVLGLPTYEW
ncbi:DUF5983 family protein, partial [Halomonas sp. AOP42-D1-22]